MYFWMDYCEEPALFVLAYLAAMIMSEYLEWFVDFLECLAHLSLAIGVEMEFSVLVAFLVLLLKALSKGSGIFGRICSQASGYQAYPDTGCQGYRQVATASSPPQQMSREPSLGWLCVAHLTGMPLNLPPGSHSAFTSSASPFPTLPIAMSLIRHLIS